MDIPQNYISNGIWNSSNGPRIRSYRKLKLPLKTKSQGENALRKNHISVIEDRKLKCMVQ